MATDAAAGLAENRRSTKAFNRQADRAVEHQVSNWISSNSVTNNAPKNGDEMPEDDETVNMDLGDRYQEIHHHHYHDDPAIAPTTTQATANTSPAAPVASTTVQRVRPVVRAAGGGLLRKAGPWLLAGALGPLAGLAGAWMLKEPTSTTNVKDVQSKAALEFYRIMPDGTRVKVDLPHISQAPPEPKP